MEDVLSKISNAGFERLSERLTKIVDRQGELHERLVALALCRDTFEAAYDVVLDVAPEREAELFPLRGELFEAIEAETVKAIRKAA